MKTELHYDQLIAGVIVSLGIVSMVARMTYGSRQWMIGVLGIVIFESAMISLFLQLRKLYLQIHAKEVEEQSVRDFNRKALAFSLMNLCSLAFVSAVFTFVMR